VNIRQRLSNFASNHLQAPDDFSAKKTAALIGAAAIPVTTAIGYQIGSQHEAMDKPYEKDVLIDVGEWRTVGQEPYKTTCTEKFDGYTDSGENVTLTRRYDCVKMKPVRQYDQIFREGTETVHTVPRPWTALGGAAMGFGLGLGVAVAVQLMVGLAASETAPSRGFDTPYVKP